MVRVALEKDNGETRRADPRFYTQFLLRVEVQPAWGGEDAESNCADSFCRRGSPFPSVLTKQSADRLGDLGEGRNILSVKIQ